MHAIVLINNVFSLQIHYWWYGISMVILRAPKLSSARSLMYLIAKLRRRKGQVLRRTQVTSLVRHLAILG